MQVTDRANPHYQCLQFGSTPTTLFRERDISVSRSQLSEKKPHEVLVCHMHDPVMFGYMNEANVNDEFIMNKLNHANMTCLKYGYTQTSYICMI